MAIHSSILAWRIVQTEEPGGLQSKGSERLRGGKWPECGPREQSQRCPMAKGRPQGMKLAEWG